MVGGVTNKVVGFIYVTMSGHSYGLTNMGTWNVMEMVPLEGGSKFESGNA